MPLAHRTPAPAPVAVRHGRGAAPGTCGELAQGVLPGGRAFVVTCPIDRGSVAQVTLAPARRLVVEGLPAEAARTAEALRRAATRLELGPVRITARLRRDLAVAKGMASSTADIVAAVRALAAAAGTELAPAELAALAAGIEPTDGVMYPGVVAADPATGARLRDWDWWPAYAIAMVVPPAIHPTPARRPPPAPATAAAHRDLLAALDDAVARRDPAAFAAQASRSAALNEPLLASPLRTALLPRLAPLGALGLCVAHTGTVAGLLFSADGDGPQQAAAAAADLAGRLGPSMRATVVRTPRWPGPRPTEP